jgi:hypothetical protein
MELVRYDSLSKLLSCDILLCISTLVFVTWWHEPTV